MANAIYKYKHLIVNRKGLYLLLKNYLHGDFIISTTRKNTKMYKLIG